MIYIIGGAPRIGKSIIGKKLAESINGRYISTDDLEEPNQDFVIFYENPKKNTLAPEKRVDSVRREAIPIIPKVQGIIDKAIDENQDVVIEGVHLFPDYVESFSKQIGNNDYKLLFIGSRNIDVIMEGMMQDTRQDNWLKNYNEEVRKQVALFTKVFSDYLYEESKTYDFNYKERSSDFQKDISEIIKELTNPIVSKK